MLAGAATAVMAAGAMASAPAMADPIPVATSYADLFEPVPNAMERLSADDASQPTAHLELAQWAPGNYHHHHHHHHHNRAWYLSNGYYWYGGRWVLRPVHHHHHHHHHHY